MKNMKHKNPMQTRHGRPRYKAFSVEQLTEMLQKATTPKLKNKISSVLNYKLHS